ncbi:hypothetical protein D3C72_1836860 [compost metagenome]
MHAEQVTVARHAVVPVRQHLRDAVAQHRRLPQQEVAQVCHLDCQQVAWIVDHDIAVQPQRAVKLAVQPRARRGQVALLALVQPGERLAGFHAVAQHGLGGAVAGSQHQAGAQGMAHGEAGIGVERGVDDAERVAVVAVQQAQGRFIQLDRARVLGGDREIP